MNFETMGIKEIVEYINEELAKDNKLSLQTVRRMVANKRGVAPDTLRKSITKKYKWNETNRAYELKEYEKINTSSVTEHMPPKELIKIMNTVLSKIDILEEKITNNNTSSAGVYVTQKEFIKSMNTVLVKIDSLENNNTNNNINSVVTIKNTKSTTTKSIRLYTEVKEELDKYILNNKNIKVIDILSNAILEYINKG